MIEEVPKGSKTVVDLTNLDKVHIDTGASMGEVKLPDVAKEVEDHLKEIRKEELIRKKSVIVASPFSQTAQRISTIISWRTMRREFQRQPLGNC
jgi:hypothetical protein